MKALRPTRHTDTAVWNHRRPHRQTDAARKRGSKMPNRFKQRETQNFGIQTRPFGRNFKQATEKTAVWHKGNTVFSPAAAVQRPLQK